MAGNSQECHICLEELRQDLVACPCGHVYHRACILQALEVNSSCPICRRRMNARQLISLYFDAPAAGLEAAGARMNEQKEKALYASPRCGHSTFDGSAHDAVKEQQYAQYERIACLNGRINQLMDCVQQQRSRNDRLVNELKTVRSQMGEVLEQKQHLMGRLQAMENIRKELQAKMTKYRVELNRQAEALREASVNNCATAYLDSCDVHVREEELQNPRDHIIALKKACKFRTEQYQKTVAEKNRLREMVAELQQAHQQHQQQSPVRESAIGPTVWARCAPSKGKTKASPPSLHQLVYEDEDLHPIVRSPSKKRRRDEASYGQTHQRSEEPPCFPSTSSDYYHAGPYSDLNARPNALPRQRLGRSPFNPSQYGSFNAKPAMNAPVPCSSAEPSVCRRGYDETGKLTNFFFPRENGRVGAPHSLGPTRSSSPRRMGPRPSFPTAAAGLQARAARGPPNQRREFALTAWLHKE